MELLGWITTGVVSFFFLSGIRIIRPTRLMLLETLGKYKKTVDQGFYWVMPFIQRGIFVNITEQSVDIKPQTVITKDNLNAVVDAVVYFQINDAIKSQYKVDSHTKQLTSLARTTLRAVVGSMSFTEANENRKKINDKVQETLDKETKNYGVNVLRVELQKIEAPNDVQVAMNDVVVAERKKIAATDFANAVEIEADGKMRASIKEAEGIKAALVLKAEGQSEAFDLVNKSFTGNAQLLKQFEVTQASLEHNSKVVLTQEGITPTLIMDAIPVDPTFGKKDEPTSESEKVIEIKEVKPEEPKKHHQNHDDEDEDDDDDDDDEEEDK